MNLSNEVLTTILKYLDWANLAKMSRISTRLKQLSEQCSLWRTYKLFVTNKTKKPFSILALPRFSKGIGGVVFEPELTFLRWRVSSAPSYPFFRIDKLLRFIDDGFNVDELRILLPTYSAMLPPWGISALSKVQSVNLGGFYVRPDEVKQLSRLVQEGKNKLKDLKMICILNYCISDVDQMRLTQDLGSIVNMFGAAIDFDMGEMKLVPEVSEVRLETGVGGKNSTLKICQRQEERNLEINIVVMR